MDSGTVMTVLGKVVPMYVAIVAGYLFARLGVMTKQGYDGLQTFVIYLAIPFQTMGVIVQTNLYNANLQIMLAVFLNAGLTLTCCLAFALAKHLLLRKNHTNSRFPINVVATYFGLLNFPNVLIVGLPLLSAMYGTSAAFVLIFVVVVRNACINPLMVTLYEIHAATRPKSKKDAPTEPAESVVTVAKAPSSEDGVEQDTKVKGEIASDSAIADPEGGLDGDSDSMDLEGRQNKRYSLQVEPVDPHATKKTFAPADENEVNDQNTQSETDVKKKRPIITIPPVLRNIISSLVKNPVMRAAFVGALYSLIAYGVDSNHVTPDVINGTMSIFNNCLSGLAFFNVGFALYGNPIIPPPSLRLQLLSGLIAKFVVAPAFMGMSAYLAGLRGSDWRVITLQAALPLAVLPYSLAQHYNTHAALMGLVITIGTILSLALVIAYYFILEVNPSFVA